MEIGQTIKFKYKDDILSGKVIGIYGNNICIKTFTTIYNLKESDFELISNDGITEKPKEVKKKIEEVKLTGFDALKKKEV